MQHESRLFPNTTYCWKRSQSITTSVTVSNPPSHQDKPQSFTCLIQIARDTIEIEESTLIFRSHYTSNQ